VPELRGQLRKIGHLDSAQVIEVPIFVAVPARTKRTSADLCGDTPDVRHEPLPLGRYAGARFARVALDDSSNEQDPAVFKPHGQGRCPDGLLHLDGLHEIDTAEVALLSNRFRRLLELFAKRTRERFVRAVPGFRRDGENLRCAAR
jgi:hypothetical protein